MERKTVFYGQDDESIYTKEGKEKLWKEENIIYADGVHAFEIIRREGLSPLVRLYTEDDGCLCSTDIIFDYEWLNSLIKLINTTHEMVDEIGNVDKFKREYECQWGNEDNK